MDIKKVVDNILFEQKSAEESLNEGLTKFIKGTAKELKKETSRAVSSAIVVVLATAFMSLVGIIVSKLSSMRNKNSQYKVIEDAYPKMVSEVMNELKPSFAKLLTAGVTGRVVSVEEMMHKERNKINRVIDRHLPKIFKELGSEIRGDVHEAVREALEEKKEVYVKEVIRRMTQSGMSEF